jgi:hypothetical protein
MGFSNDDFTRRRPYLYHLTAVQNIARIRRTMELECARSLLSAAGERRLIRERRTDGYTVAVGGEHIHIRDQAPLHRGNMQLETGWAFEDFVAHLNARVFFWPGNEVGPIAYGLRHYERYADDRPVMLRVSTASLFALNVGREPRFCRYNSGSPRCSYGRKSPRKSDTFQRGSDASFSPAQVVEVTFEDRVQIPDNTQIASTPSGPWDRLLSH